MGEVSSNVITGLISKAYRWGFYHNISSVTSSSCSPPRWGGMRRKAGYMDVNVLISAIHCLLSRRETGGCFPASLSSSL